MKKDVEVEELLRTRREQIIEIARKHGAYNLSVFGSMARGDNDDQSDIDFLVEVGPIHSPWFPAGLVADLEELLGVPVDVVTRDGLHWFIKERILEEARPL
ncbi:MAG TPA: nucleotidyltransferase family protein [Anaerolineales bacterium]|nr:nucleotidyltransferase family protein [Anaerolineales bacterium]